MKSSIDFNKCIKQEPDNPPVPFSFMNDRVWIAAESQLPCHLTFADQRVGQLVRDNLHVNRHVVEEVVFYFINTRRIRILLLLTLGSA